ncbi:P-loop containing nucleoside triphosphate hydrolase protein [Dipodascopsis tothii]|uniref:P-loop containing nucleoside triphosphate hydrolase protein n=1 Tax=Dipodascopsis tothii TaxID=44089 RepID=UPI0034CEE284
MVQRPPKKKNPNANPSGLGRAIINDTKTAGRTTRRSARHTVDNAGVTQPSWMRLKSVTQERDLDEFLNTAELAGTDFTAERLNVTIIHQDQTNPYLLTPEQERAARQKQDRNSKRLTVPRRPQWTAKTTGPELERAEKDAFLEWRRGLAELQENQDLLMTPFERNLEVWRQLWRVVERSNLVVQICDARNPLFYRSPDLEVYTKELDPAKRNLLLINKADMLTLNQRVKWAQYFKREGINFAFFSASLAGGSKNTDASVTEQLARMQLADANRKIDADDVTEADVHILHVSELEALFLREAPRLPAYDGGPTDKIYIGLVGYPNVGKSSTINSLLGAKKVSVSATPGKTKHFQTIILPQAEDTTEQIILCDCPGLVFPNFASTKAELVCNGVLPIDQLREYTGPATLLAQRVPQQHLERLYGITIYIKPEVDGGTGVPTGTEILKSYAAARGLIKGTKGGIPDESQAARRILKDFVTGKILYVAPPPGEDPVAFNAELYE